MGLRVRVSISVSLLITVRARARAPLRDPRAQLACVSLLSRHAICTPSQPLAAWRGQHSFETKAQPELGGMVPVRHEVGN